MRSAGFVSSLEPISLSATVTIWLGPRVGRGNGGVAVADGDGPGDAPFTGIAGGVLSRSMKMGPDALGLGEPVGRGGGVMSVPVGIGVGGINWPGPGGGTFGILSGVGEGEGVGVSVSSEAGLGEDAAPDVSVALGDGDPVSAGFGLGLGTCATTTGMLSASIRWIAFRSSACRAVEGLPHDSRISLTKRGSSESESEAAVDG